MYRFLLSPKWILSHLFVLALVITMVILGIWQLDRLGQRQDRNAQVQAQSDLAVAELGDVVSVDQGGDLEPLRFRKVEVTGEFLVGDEVDIRNASFDGTPGYWVLTPLLLEDGTAVAVNRGWVPLALHGHHPRPEAAPPEGTVTVSGWLQLSDTAKGFESEDPAEGVLEDMARPDIGRFAQQLSYPLYPVYLTLQTPDPGQGGFPRLIPEPVLDEGPHFSYAVQWFLFSLIGGGGYLLVLRRRAREKAGLVPAHNGLVPPPLPNRDKKVLK